MEIIHCSFRCPLIFIITINRHESYSHLPLFYTVEEIDVTQFHPKLYSLLSRLKRQSLAVEEYVQTMISTIIENILRGEMFGDVSKYYRISTSWHTTYR